MRRISAPTRSAEALQGPRRPLHRGEARRIETLLAVARREAEEAVDPQPVLGDARVRVADEADPGLTEVAHDAERVEQGPGHVGIEGVDREVPPLGIALPVVAEADDGMPSVGFDVLAQGRDFGDEAAGAQRHGAVGNAGGVGGHAVPAGPGHHLLGQQFGGEVDLAAPRHAAQQGIADHPADRPGAPFRSIEQREHRLGFGPHQPFGGTQPPFELSAAYHGRSPVSARS